MKSVILFVLVFLCKFSSAQITGKMSVLENKSGLSIIGKWKVVDIQNKQPGWHVDITGDIYDFKSDQSLVVTPADSLSEAQTFKYHKDETRVTVITDDENSFEYHYTLHGDRRLELDSSTENIILKPEN